MKDDTSEELESELEVSLLESELELESDSDTELDVKHVEEDEVVGCDEGPWLG